MVRACLFEVKEKEQVEIDFLINWPRIRALFK